MAQGSVRGTEGDQFRFEYDSAHYLNFDVAVDGSTTVSIVGEVGASLAFAGAIAWGGGAVIPSSGVVARTDQSNVLNGRISIGAAHSANNLAGLRIHQGADVSEVFSLAATGVAHGMTSRTDTDTYLFIRPFTGGALLETLGNSDRSWFHLAAVTTATTTKSASASANAPFISRGVIKSGTGLGTMPANSNLHVWQNNTTTVAILDGDGDLHLDASLTQNAWDDHDDVALIAGLRGSLMDPKAAARWGLSKFIDAARPVLEETGIVTYNEDGHHFLSLKGALFFTMDAVRQVHGRAHERMDLHESRIASLEIENATLRQRLAAAQI